MTEHIGKRTFSDLDLHDTFFDGLRKDYGEFDEWYGRKSKQGAEAYVLECDGRLTGFMYLKVEEGEVQDTTPNLGSAKRIKIGTLKVDAHGTRLGERFLKKAFDFALAENADELYLTVFPKHDPLIDLIAQLGFDDVGEKISANGAERVYLKDLRTVRGGLRQDYPLLHVTGVSKYLLSVYPEWHTQLFPDSILDNESYDVLADVSHTNSIRKTYVCFMDIDCLTARDIVVIYRTKDDKGPAYYRSVVTSVCSVEEVRPKASFTGLEEYIEYTMQYSVFNKSELTRWWNRGDRLFVIKMLYNAAFSKRLIRKDLIEQVGLDERAYWGFMQLSDGQFSEILKRGGVDERLVVGKA